MSKYITLDILGGFVLAGVLLIANYLGGVVLHALMPSCF